MNKTKIEWTDYTWNPVTGCLNNCPYCYARKIATRFKGTKTWPRGFEPTFHPERLDEPRHLKKPSKIFVCSMGELFGKWVPDHWFFAVLDVIEGCPQHIFQILTKFPKEGSEKWYLFPENVWLGVTIDSQHALQQAIWLSCFEVGKKFISFEPLLERIYYGHSFSTKRHRIDWVIIGGLTKRGRVVFSPPYEWVDLIIKQARRGHTKIWVKENALYPKVFKEMPYTSIRHLGGIQGESSEA